jgi:hypothetical protein
MLTVFAPHAISGPGGAYRPVPLSGVEFMPLSDVLKNAVRNGVVGALAAELQEIVVKETRRALRDHEDQLTVIVRAAIADAIAELLAPEAQ